MNGLGVKKSIVGHLCAAAVSGVFLYAALAKIQEPRQFAVDINNFQFLPVALVNLMAILLPWWEVGGALALLHPSTRRGGAIVLNCLLFMFIIAVSYAAFYKNLNIHCGCFGKDNPAAAGWRTIGLDVTLLLGTWLSVAWMPRRSAATVSFDVDGIGSEESLSLEFRKSV